MLKKYLKKRGMRLYILSLTVFIIILIVMLIMLKYNVEGEKNLPFNVSKIVTVSSAQTINTKLEGSYLADIIQKNDIYISLSKNQNYKKEDAIKKVILNNFSVINSSNAGIVEIYKPSKTEKLFEYIEENKIKDSVEIFGAQHTNYKADVLEIANQRRYNPN